MHTVIVSVATVTNQFSSEVVSAGIIITLGSASITIGKAPYVATFEGVSAGDYIITATAKDVDGNTLGIPVEGTVTIAPDVVNIDVPASISVEVI